jgi:tRNA1(Val) A37 N6-methylase TrmN6
VLIYPLWPRAGSAAKLMIAQGVKGGRGPCVLSAGLALHEADGSFTSRARAILRDGAALPLQS